MNEKLKIGLIGCGAISGAYLKFSKLFPLLDITACADLDPQKSAARAAEFQIPKSCSPGQLLTDPSIDIVLNLTIPAAHAAVSLQALSAGKHVFCEKPLATTLPEARKVLDTAQSKNLRVGCAPDTFLGSALQTARKLIDDGVIGRPLAFTAFMMGKGHEHWHPNPEFFYEPGAGPMFDMGPYYLTALVNLLGPIKRITGAASIAIPERTITSDPKKGRTFTVQTPDHICGTIEFDNGCIGTIITSFAIPIPAYDEAHPITLYGTEGTLKIPDPNLFDGSVLLRRTTDPDFHPVLPAFPQGFGRAVGLADLAHALRSNRPHRATGAQAFLVLEAMQAFLDSARTGRSVAPATPYQRPAPMPASLPLILDD